MVYINFISGLVTQNPATDKEVYVQAYGALGDGAGGYFVWRLTAELPSGTTANNGIWFTGPVSTGLWERQFSKQGAINVKWFGAQGTSVTDDNDTLAIQATINFASIFGYKVFIPKGSFNVNTVSLKSNVQIFGEGNSSVLLLKDEAAQFIFFVDTQNGSTSNNINNVSISDLKFDAVVHSFSDHKHFICVNGISNLTIERCLFQQFRGDAIYLGAGVGISSHITHNENITVRNCIFDGVTKENRNAISILDCNQLLIENNSFKNTTKNTMPGAIDIEPDPPVSGSCNEILKNITIQNNSFYNIGGNVGCFSVALPPSNPFTVPPSGIYFLNNHLENVVSGFTFINRYIPGTGIDTKVKLPFFLENNVLKNASVNGFALYGACYAKIAGNYINSVGNSLIGYTSSSDTCTDVIVENNIFDKCGSSGGGIGLSILNCKRVKLNCNTFNDCGTGTVGASNAIDFNVSSSSDYITFEQNIFLSPTGKTLVAIQKEATHTFTNPRNNRFFNNQLNALTTFFQYINDNNFGSATVAVSASSALTILHNLGSTPSWVTIQPKSALPAGISIIYITVNSTVITVTFSGSFTASVNLWWSVEA